MMFRILVALYVWRQKRKLIALQVRMFPALYLPGVAKAIDIDLRDLLTAMLANLCIAPAEIRAAAIGDVSIVANVGDVDCFPDDNHVARTFVNAPAAVVGIGPKIADVHE